MRNMVNVSLVFGFIVFAIMFNQSNALGWEIVKERDGIKVFARPNPGSDIDEFKGVSVMNVGVEVILALLADIKNQPKWMDRCSEGKLIKKYSDFERIIYNVTEAPWPISDRDVVVHQKAKFDNKGGVKIFFAATPDDNSWVPRSGERVRMTTLKGSITLAYIDKHHTEVIYLIKTDPGGKIPTWIANYASRLIPFNTLKNITELTKTPEYKEKAIELVESNSPFLTEIMKSRIRATSKTITDQKLIELLQEDKELLKLLMTSKDETITIVQNRVNSNYKKENDKWVFVP